MAPVQELTRENAHHDSWSRRAPRVEQTCDRQPLSDQTLNNLNRLHPAGWWAAVAFALAITLPWCFAKGMFWDGVVYGSVAQNLSHGIGDFWHPQVTATFMHRFHEHPPLAFWLQSLLFRVVGDHFWVERVYGLLTAIVVWSILIATWRCLTRDVPSATGFGWLALAIWVPWGTWCVRHNMLENTLGVFTTLAVYASLRALESPRRNIAWSLLAGLAITAAVLTKGPVGMFPAATPLLAAIALRQPPTARTVVVQRTVVATFAVTFLGILLSPDARDYLAGYWHVQLASAFMLHREHVHGTLGHFNIVWSIIRELRIPTAVFVALWLLARKWKLSTSDSRLNGARWFCILTALSASLPLAISPKQGAHYIAPSWPYYAFAVALCCVPVARSLLVRALERSDRVVPRSRWLIGGAAAAIAILSVISVHNYGRPQRDQALIAISDEIGAEVTPGTTVIPGPWWNEIETSAQLKVHAYLYRFYSVSLFVDELRPAFNLECHRLERPDPRLTAVAEPLTTKSGLVCQLFIPPEHVHTASVPVARAR